MRNLVRVEEYNSGFSISQQDGWVLFKQIDDMDQGDEKGTRSTRKVGQQNSDEYESQLEFRISIIPTQENLDKAYGVLREMYVRPTIHPPRLAKIVDMNQESSQLSWRPELGNPHDQRGKELCFYVTWAKDRATDQVKPSLTAAQYKAFMLHTIKALQDAGVEGIGYFPSYQADRKIKGALPFITYLDCLQGVKENNLFQHKALFNRFGFVNPLEDITITSSDLRKAGINIYQHPNIDSYKKDLESRLKNFADALISDETNPLQLLQLDRLKYTGPHAQAQFDNDVVQQRQTNEEAKVSCQQRYKHLRKIVGKINELQHIVMPEFSFFEDNKHDYVRIRNASSNLLDQIYHMEGLTLQPQRGNATAQFKKAFNKSKDEFDFANKVYDVLKGTEFNFISDLADKERKIKDLARAMFTTIKKASAGDRAQMGFFSRLWDSIMSLFGRDVTSKQYAEESQSFVARVVSKYRSTEELAR